MGGEGEIFDCTSVAYGRTMSKSSWLREKGKVSENFGLWKKGIPKFFRWLSERYPLINISVGEGDLKIPEFGTLKI